MLSSDPTVHRTEMPMRATKINHIKDLFQIKKASFYPNLRNIEKSNRRLNLQQEYNISILYLPRRREEISGNNIKYKQNY